MCSKYSCSSWVPWHSSTQRLWHWGALPCSAPGGSWPPPAVGHGLKGLRHFPASSLSVLGLVYWAWLFLGLVYQSTVVTKEFILSIFSVLMFLSYYSFPFHPSLILLEAREGIFSPIVIFCLSLRGWAEPGSRHALQQWCLKWQHLVRKTLTPTSVGICPALCMQFQACLAGMWQGERQLCAAEVPQICILLCYLFANTMPGGYYSAT